MQRIIKATATVGGMTMISRVLGFIRDMVIARFFGASAGADAFFVAFKIPNFFRRLFAEGAFSQAFVPVLADIRNKEGDAGVKRFVASILFRLGGILLIITILGVLFAPWIMSLFAPGFRDDVVKFALATDMLRLTFPYLMLISLVALSSALMNTYSRFGVPAFTPVWLNLVLIGSAIWLAPMLDVPVMALAWGVLIAGVVQLVFHLPYLWKMGLLVRPVYEKHKGVSEVWTLMIPALFGVSVAQINLLIDTILASFLVTGSVSWLYYSDRLMEFPLGVFGVALATVVLPGLSKKAANKDWKGFEKDLVFAIKLVFLIGLPAMLGLVLLASPLITTLFFYGEFSQQDVSMASMSLMAYALGLLGFILVKVLAPAFYSRKDMKTPVKIAIAALLTNLVLNLILIWHLAHVGLALATAAAAILNSSLLFIFLRKQGVFNSPVAWKKFALQVGGSSLVMVGFLLAVTPVAEVWLDFSAWMRVLWLAGLVLGSLVVYAVSLLTLGFRPRAFLRNI